MLIGKERVFSRRYQVARKGLGLVPEGRQIFPNLTVLENIMVAAANRGGRAEPYTLDEVLKIFPRLAERLKNYVNQLSGGEQQMLAVVRALMTTPKLLSLNDAIAAWVPCLQTLVLLLFRRRFRRPNF